LAHWARGPGSGLFLPTDAAVAASLLGAGHRCVSAAPTRPRRYAILPTAPASRRTPHVLRLGQPPLPKVAVPQPPFYTSGKHMPPIRTARTPGQPATARAEDSPSATLGYEAELWRMADALRGAMDAAEYKHVVLGLIFLKYISDAFEEHHARLVAEQAQGADPEDPDEYRAQSIFWVPPEARWSTSNPRPASPPSAGCVDDAMTAIERDNPALKASCPKTTPAPRSTNPASASSLTSSPTSGSATRPAAPRTCSAAFTNTSSPSSPAPRARKAASSTPPAAWSSCSSRCSNPTAAAFTTPAAAPRACSCSPSSSSAPTPPATATAAAPAPTSPSTARNPTTPPGGWPR
jgi:hypothetical protein